MLISDWISDLCSSDLLIKMDVVDPPYMAPSNTPANKIEAATGPTDTVTGNSNAKVNAGPMPGRMPIAVPNIGPIRAHIRLMGVSATSKPCSNSAKVSITHPPRERSRPAAGPASRTRTSMRYPAQALQADRTQYALNQKRGQPT